MALVHQIAPAIHPPVWPPCSYALAHPNQPNRQPCSYNRYLCDEEPTGRPVGGRPNHPPNEIYLLCHNCRFHFLGQHVRFQQVAEDHVLGRYIFEETSNPAAPVPTFRLRNNAVIRGSANMLEALQAPLCNYCEKDEVSLYRTYEQDPENFVRSITDPYSGPLDSCTCFRKCISWKHYCDTCSRDALDDRQMIGTMNLGWLSSLGRTQAGHLRPVDDNILNYRNSVTNLVVCRCGRETGPQRRPKATFCLCCGGVKIWIQNLEEPRRPVRGTRNIDMLPQVRQVYEMEYGPEPGVQESKKWLGKLEFEYAISRVYNGP